MDCHQLAWSFIDIIDQNIDHVSNSWPNFDLIAQDDHTKMVAAAAAEDAMPS